MMSGRPGASSTRWKSSKIRTPPPACDVGSSRMNASSCLAHGPPPAPSKERRRRRARSPDRARGPAATRWCRSVTQSRSSGSSRYHRVRSRSRREVGEQRRLAVTGVGEDQDDSAMDLDPQPVEQARSFERLVAERRTLDLRRSGSGSRCLRRSGGHSAGRRRLARASRTYGDRRPLTCEKAERRLGPARTISTARAGCQRSRSRGRSGMGAMVAPGRSSGD